MKTFENTMMQSKSIRKSRGASKLYSKSKYNMDSSYFSKNDNFKVWVRIRPLDDKEKKDFTYGKSEEDNTIFNHDEYSCTLKEDKLTYDYTGKNAHTFHYDYVFGSKTDNNFVFEQALKPMLPSLLEGFNVTCMAYGITGAGKTYTMLGNTMETPQSSYFHKDFTEVEGISSLALGYIFKAINSDYSKGQQFETSARQNILSQFNYKIKVSYLEVYNEQIRDLLREGKPINLMILEDAKRGIIIPGLKECEFWISDYKGCVETILQYMTNL